MGNSAVYGDRTAKRIIHDESITDDEVEAELKTGQIIVQLGAGGGTHYLTKPPHDITLTKMEIFGSVNGATTGTAAGLTVTLKKADAGGATTATVAAGALNGTTTAGSGVESFPTALSASIASTKGLYLVCGATTLIDDNVSAVIQYTID